MNSTKQKQPCDHGFLNEKPVLNVIRKGAIAIHYVKSDDPFSTGDIVQQKVDWDRRFDHMQQHSGFYTVTDAGRPAGLNEM